MSVSAKKIIAILIYQSITQNIFVYARSRRWQAASGWELYQRHQRLPTSAIFLIYDAGLTPFGVRTRLRQCLMAKTEIQRSMDEGIMRNTRRESITLLGLICMQRRISVLSGWRPSAPRYWSTQPHCSRRGKFVGGNKQRLIGLGVKEIGRCQWSPTYVITRRYSRCRETARLRITHKTHRKATHFCVTFVHIVFVV